MKTFNGRVLFFIALGFTIASFFIPYNSLEFLLGEGLRPIGFVLLFLNPVFAGMGLLYSMKDNDPLFIILHCLLFFSFFITMFIGNLVF